MKAQQLQENQNLAQFALGKKLKYDDFMSLFEPEIDLFFENLNGIIEQQFQFEHIKQYLDSQGTEMPEKWAKRTVSFNDLIKPCIDPHGELSGFKVRHELIKAMHLGNEENPVFLKRAIKVCLFLNRLLNEGKDTDFALKDMTGIQEKTYAEAECQVDE